VLHVAGLGQALRCNSLNVVRPRPPFRQSKGLLHVEVALNQMILGMEDPTTAEQDMEEARWDLHLQIWNAHTIYVPVELL
jgi:hypothetical protein